MRFNKILYVKKRVCIENNTYTFNNPINSADWKRFWIAYKV